jgi:type II secretory pathway component PulC
MKQIAAIVSLVLVSSITGGCATSRVGRLEVRVADSEQAQLGLAKRLESLMALQKKMVSQLAELRAVVSKLEQQNRTLAAAAKVRLSARRAVSKRSHPKTALRAVPKRLFTKSKKGRYQIKRAALNRILGNTTMLARSARLVPAVRNGKGIGFKIYAIRPGSIYDQMGIKNGDTVTHINGYAITSPARALMIYTKVRSATRLTITLRRVGKSLTFTYEVIR